MRLLLLQILIFLSCCPAWAQMGKWPDGFLNIAWGASQEEVKQKLQSRPGVEFKDFDSGDMIFTGGDFAGHSVNTWKMYFENGKFYRGDVLLGSGGNRVELHQKLKKDLVDKYSAPARTWGDGTCRWNFPQSASHRSAEVIQLAIDHRSNEVHVYYVSGYRAQILAASKDR